MLCETPTVIADHAFTTGKIKRNSIERVLPNTCVEFAMKDGLGCDASHYAPAELQGKTMPDEHVHEHATCFNLKDRGLVVISSCGHVGIVNSVRQAQEVSGVQKVHAIVGGFHLGPAPPTTSSRSLPRSRRSSRTCVIPMHCSGDNFIQRARADAGQALIVDDRQPPDLRRVMVRTRSGLPRSVLGSAGVIAGCCGWRRLRRPKRRAFGRRADGRR